MCALNVARSFQLRSFARSFKKDGSKSLVRLRLALSLGRIEIEETDQKPSSGLFTVKGNGETSQSIHSSAETVESTS